jgi:hypothetical protein
MNFEDPIIARLKKTMSIIPRLNFVLIGSILLIVCGIFTTGFYFQQNNLKNSNIRGLVKNYAELVNEYNSCLLTANVLNDYYEELFYNYEQLKVSYETILDSGTTVDDNETALFLEKLQEEYSRLQNRTLILQEEIDSLRYELDALSLEMNEILNLEKYVVLDENRTIEIQPDGNATLVYDITYAGYMTINVTSSSEIVIWVGSSLTDGIYYARFPSSFPDTLTESSIIVPICSTTYLYVINPSDQDIVYVELSISYVY